MSYIVKFIALAKLYSFQALHSQELSIERSPMSQRGTQVNSLVRSRFAK